MKRILFLSFICIFASGLSANAQQQSFPRDLNSLANRAQQFWSYLESGQRLKALDLVLAEKRELLLATGGMPFLRPKITGIDFTGDGERALVRVSVQLVSKEAPGQYLSWVVTDTWVWKKNAWYLDLTDAKRQNPFQGNAAAAPGVPPVPSDLDSKFKVLQTVFDLGVVLQGERRKIVIPVEYGGAEPFAADVTSLGDLISAETQPLTIKPETKELTLWFDSREWDGAFTIPVAIKVRNSLVSTGWQISVRGSVFAPVAFRQSPSPFVDGPGQQLRILVHNASDETIVINSVSSDDAFEVLEIPSPIPGKSEGEIRLSRKTTDLSKLVTIRLAQPVNGKSLYLVQLRLSSAP
jgi:hypothetical protein